MDFGTIRSKLEQGKYTDSSQLLKDAQQVFVNCYTFNLSDDIVYHMGQEIEAEFNKLCAAKGLKGVEVSSHQQASEAVEQPTYAFSDTTSVVPEISGTKRSLEIYDDEDQDSGMVSKSILITWTSVVTSEHDRIMSRNLCLLSGKKSCKLRKTEALLGICT